MSKRQLIIVPIEPIETRYTKHWYSFLPEMLKKKLSWKFDVEQLEVPFVEVPNDDGAFFNFSATMLFKSRQAEYIASMFVNKLIKPGTVFLYTDYWNPTVAQIKYMSEYTGIPVTLVGIAHAGFWDPADMLPRNGDKKWGEKVEKMLLETFDALYFSTQFSESLFVKYHSNTGTGSDYEFGKSIVTGFPMEYYDDVFAPYWELTSPPPKEDIVVFPHRKSDEKNLDLFNQLAEKMPGVRFIVAMDVCKNKFEYHNLLYRSKVAFSASLQETLGISMGIEAPRAGCETLVPNRLSYKEMAFDKKYPHYIANNYGPHYEPAYVDYLVGLIRRTLNEFDIENARKVHDENLKKFFSGDRMYEHLLTL